MKKIILSSLILIGFNIQTEAQITITASDVPASGDTLRSSAADITTSIDLSTTGANSVWDFSLLEPTSQAIDTYKSALSVSPLLVLSLNGAYGLRTDVSGLTGGLSLPVSITDFYQFYQKRTNPSKYVGRGYGATISGVTAPLAYGDEDEIYFFPLTFGNNNNSTFSLATTIPSLGDLKIDGTRTTDVDGWGTIVTPFFTTPTQCIRVKSTIDEIDSLVISGTPIGFPRTTIEYKWLVAGSHYPALVVTASSLLGTETVTSIRFKDKYRQLASIPNLQSIAKQLNAYPNPSNDKIKIDIPSSWQNYLIDVFDMKGTQVLSIVNKSELDLKELSAGKYLVRVISGTSLGLVQVERL